MCVPSSGRLIARAPGPPSSATTLLTKSEPFPSAERPLTTIEWIKLMIPTGAAEKLGLRPAIPRARLKKVWRVLSADPKTLPDKHKERYALLQDKLHAGDVFRVAEAVRDMTWRRQRRGNLTTTGMRLYEEGMGILAGEIAAVQGLDMGDAEAQVRERLSESLSPVTVM